MQSLALCPITYSLLSALRPIFLLVDALLSRTYVEYGPIDHTYPYSPISPTQPGPILKKVIIDLPLANTNKGSGLQLTLSQKNTHMNMQ